VVRDLTRRSFGRLLAGVERLVGRGAVQARYGNVLKPKIYSQLTAVMDEVVEEVRAVGTEARQVADHVLAERELPGLLELVVRQTGEGGAALVGICGEGGDQRFMPAEGVVGKLVVRVCHVHTGRGEDGVPELRQSGDVHSEVAEVERLLVGPEGGVFIRDALENPAGAGYFGVEVGEEKLCNLHGRSLSVNVGCA